MLIDINGNEITGDPTYYSINVIIPADRYSEEKAEELANKISELLQQNEIYHFKPEIKNMYA